MYRIVLTCLFAVESLTALAQTSNYSPKLRSVLQDLTRSTQAEYHRQITAAIDCSPALAQEMNNRAKAGELTQIRVLPMSQLSQPKGAKFLAYTDRTAIVIAEELLEELRKERLYDVVHPDDIPPNNTAFVLRHLAEHLAYEIEPKNFDNPIAYANAKLESEARAWMYGWNVVADCARQRNGKSLTAGQGGKLLLNFRYRAILFRAIGIPKEPAGGRPTVQLTNEGAIEANAENISAFVETLRVSKMIDIE